MSLTEKQRKFAKEYIIDLNATEAAKRAGYSEKTAYSIGSENLKKPEIKKFIKNLQDRAAKNEKITQETIIKELKKIGFADIDLKAIKPADKLKALEIMSRMLGLEKPMHNDIIEKLDQVLGDIDVIANR